MNKTTLLMILQALSVSVQVVNAGAATTIHNPVATLLIAAFAAGLSVVVQQVGNSTVPSVTQGPGMPQDPPKP